MPDQISRGALTSALVAMFMMSSDPAEPAEIRIGAMQTRGGPEQGNGAVSLEVRSPPVFALAGAPFRPRLSVGMGVLMSPSNTSYMFVDATARFDLDPRLFLEGGLGLAANDGVQGERAPPGRAAMGCAWGFREAIAVGIVPRRDLSILFVLEHISNAKLCDRNQGLTLIGMKLGVRF
jgi:lipid A 3-O-deacylase